MTNTEITIKAYAEHLRRLLAADNDTPRFIKEYLMTLEPIASTVSLLEEQVEELTRKLRASEEAVKEMTE